MKLTTSEVISQLKIITPDVFGDSRGWFYEMYSEKKFADLGINIKFVQDNTSFSKQKGTLRGLHFQTEPMAQTKLVSCVRGEILDVAVDLRVGSPTYLKFDSVILSEENKKMFLIPKGFAHGFLTLTDDVQVMYKVDEFYSYENDRSIKFDDPAIGVDWGCGEVILSDKDKKAPLLCDSDANFVYGGKL
ncbi:MAG: dTDP-4-dehydrorhamnose 3,5-epimerase [Clostridia bacterium]